MRKPNVALLTDFSSDSIYVGLMKATIAKICPDANIIDLSHSIEPQNIKQAAFILANTVDYFPEGTIFCCVIDPNVGSERRAIAVKTDIFYFVCPDNGIISYCLENHKPQIAIDLTDEKYHLKHKSKTFHGRDVFAPVTAHLANRIDIARLGNPIDFNGLAKIPKLFFNIDGNGNIEGEILFCDAFGNLITSIHKSQLGSNSYKILLGNILIEGISMTYSDVPDNSFVAYIGSMDYLEIGIRNANAKKYFGEELPQRIRLTRA